MSSIDTVDEHRAASRADQPTTTAAALTALGIVYGDLGTSPLYTLQAVSQAMDGKFSAAAALGSLSLIFWLLIVTISIKYCQFVMRADNHGEGGILALMSMTGANWRGRGRVLIVMGLFGAALIYGDGIITPAISVLSALEGLNVATDFFKPHVMPMAAAILLILFAVQSRGTARIGRLFGPIMLTWFVSIAVLGLGGVLRHPEVLAAVNPAHALRFLLNNPRTGIAVLGAVFLAVTGGEALYADMGHIGRNPIRTMWYGVVLPALLLNYAGETALFLDDPAMTGNPFFRLVPSWAIYPTVGLATVATIIASQAIITGSYSMTRQAMQLGWFPGVRIRQTSDEEYGQIYVPFINWIMMICTIALTVGFASSSRLAGAYGTAVSTTMLLTTMLLYRVMRDRWGWPTLVTLIASAVFFMVDFVLFAANLVKIRDGGWIPLGFGLLIFVVMTTWRYGIEAMRAHQDRAPMPPNVLIEKLREMNVPRVPGTAIFLTRVANTTPPLLIRHVEQFGTLQQTVVALSVKFADVPRIPRRDRLDIKQLAEGFWQISAHFGFVQIPDLPAALRQAKQRGCQVDLRRPVFFHASDEVVASPTLGILARVRLRLFAFMQRNSVRAVDLFLMPTDNFVDVGRRLEIGARGDENRHTGQRGEADIDLKREPDGKQRGGLRRRGRGAVKL
jgi:KUP system potassium uptake protein